MQGEIEKKLITKLRIARFEFFAYGLFAGILIHKFFSLPF